MDVVEYSWAFGGVKWYCSWSRFKCWRLLANIDSFWSNSVVTKSEIGSFEFDPVVGWGSEGGGVSGWFLEMVDGCVGLVVKIGGDEDDEAVAVDEETDVLDDNVDLLRFRGWY